MKVLLAGATGVIGRPLTTALITAGHQVLALARTPQAASTVTILGATPIHADALDPDSLKQGLHGHTADAVIHQLTALKTPKRKTTADDPNNILRIRGTANLIAAADQLGATRFLTQSLVLGYGYFDHGTHSVTEADKFGVKTGSVADHIVTGLQAAEDQTLARGGIALRYGLFFGPGTWFDPAARGKFPIPFGGGGTVPWVHVTDAANATVKALERGEPNQAYNITSGASANWSTIAANRGLPLPGWMLRLAVPYLGALMLDTSLHVSHRKATAALGWVPRHTPGVPS